MFNFHPLPTATARAYQSGSPDAYGNPPEHLVSDGDGNPCRHCLCDIPAGADMLVLAHRPFSSAQPYAETGPIFLCATPCPAAALGADLPNILAGPQYIMRGYGSDERIKPGTGGVVVRQNIKHLADELFARSDIAHIDIRSASNNCFLVRLYRA